MKNYKSAPLPFMGQKRNFIKHFQKVIKQCPSDAIYVDLFGGSGLLSHNVKFIHPNAKVIYNDYDGYAERIKNIIKTNCLLSDLRSILEHYPRGKKIDGIKRKQVLDRIQNEKGYIDYITLSSSIGFSMNYMLSFEELLKTTLYNNVKKNNYSIADDYLSGLEIIKMDYKALFKQYSNSDNVIFLIDPPYLSTESKTYNNYWKLKDYLEVLEILDNQSYFYFTSNKSNLIELMEWVESKTNFNPFSNAQSISVSGNPSSTSSYTDIMLYTFK